MAYINQPDMDIFIEGVRREEFEDVYPLTPIQQGMHFHTVNSPGTGMYLIQQRFTLQGPLDVSACKEAFDRVVSRHQILRAAFLTASTGEPYQVVYRHLELPWEAHDWRHLPAAEQEERVEALMRADRERGFDLSKAPLMGVTLIRLGEDLYELIWSFHHMLLDGWSIALVLKDILTIYEMLCRNERIDLGQPVPYADYLNWLSQQDRGQAEAYWRKTLSGFTAPTMIGSYRAEAVGPERGDDFKEETLLLDEDATADLRSFARNNKLTLNSILQGAWALLLSRWSGFDDVVFGNVVSGRPVSFPRGVSAVGVFINTLPVRVNAPSDVDLLTWLRDLQMQQVEARRFEYCSLIDIQRWSEVPPGRPLFETVMVFQNFPMSASLSAPGQRLKLINTKSVERNNNPLAVIIEPNSQLLVRMVYSSLRFENAVINRIMDQIRKLLAEIVKSPTATLASLSINTSLEKKRLIDNFNQSLS